MTGTFNFRETSGIDLSKLRDAVAESLFFLDELLRTGGSQDLKSLPETLEIVGLLERVSDAEEPLRAMAFASLEAYADETELGEFSAYDEIPSKRVLH